MELTAQDKHRKRARLFGIAIFLVCFVLFGLMTYGGVRASDDEIVFRMGESIAERGEISLEKDLEAWPGFGVAFGRENKIYSIFGPLESVVLAPIIKIAGWINETGWYESLVSSLPQSYTVENGLADVLKGLPPRNPRPHALRLLSSIYNVLVSALGVLVFWRILLLITKSIGSSLIVTLFYAFGTLVWPYASTFFSEPLATLLILLSFYYLLLADNVEPDVGRLRAYKPVFLSGIWLGLAATAHITAILFAPFFALYFYWKEHADQRSVWQRLERASIFIVGVSILLFLLGCYNYYRFSSFFETGRSVGRMAGEAFGYGWFVSPFRGLFGLLFGAGKGLLFFVPASIAGIALWKSFHRYDRKLFWVILAAVAFRILFIASRSDWAGGFCVGPRYMIMVLPFFLLPAGIWLGAVAEHRLARSFFVVTACAFLCSVEQLFFSLGEVFLFLHKIKWEGMSVGINVFSGDMIYLDWRCSPLVHPEALTVSSFFLRNSGFSLGALWLIGSAVLLLLYAASYLVALRVSHFDNRSPR